jgi:murein DD-endopeptidase MepM/ murein hydrolase activator NlpD
MVQASSETAYSNEVLGVQLADTAGLQLVEDQMLGEQTYGFTLVRAQDHETGDEENGEMVLRVGLRYDAAPNVDEAVTDLLSQYPELTVDQTALTLDGLQGTMIQGVPGRYGSTYIYVVANNQLYEIIYASDTLDATGQSLLDQITFVPPTSTLASLGMESATDRLYESSPYPADDPKLPDGTSVSDFQVDEELVVPSPPEGIMIEAASACADWPTSIFIQTPIKKTANNNGTTTAGPHWYGQGRHVNCNRPNRLNDFYALDFPLRTGDEVLAPFEGTVKWADWAKAGWSELGRIVIVERIVGADRYWSMSAHLSSILVQPGDIVTPNTVIGLAGGSGNGSNNFWSPHLHQGIYLNANLDRVNGGIFGGQSVQPLNVRFFANGGGTYATIQPNQVISW